MFTDQDVNLNLLRQRAYNLRWASVAEDVIPLTAADPDFPCAPEIAEAITSYSRGRYFSYGPPEGLPDFREAMAAFYTNKRNVRVSPGQLFPVDSAAFGIYLTCRALLTSGDEAIIFDPVDFLFRYSVEATGAKAVALPTPVGRTGPDFEQLEQLITSRTRMICICNPLNPTGKVFSAEELRQFAVIARQHNLYILSDEIWSDIVFSPATYTSIACLDDDTRNRTITVTGFSKSYGLAGLRIGTVMTHNAALYERLFTSSLHNATIHGANTLGQVAATAALTQCQGWLQQFVEHLHSMRDKVVSLLNNTSGFSCIAPEGCYVAFADIRATGLTSQQMADKLLNEAKVAVVPGLPRWFGNGAEGYIRLSFATSGAIIDEAFERIMNVIK